VIRTNIVERDEKVVMNSDRSSRSVPRVISTFDEGTEESRENPVRLAAKYLRSQMLENNTVLLQHVEDMANGVD
jgi:hypothetical protein